MYIVYMGLLTWSLNGKREMLIETLQNHEDYRGFTKADLLESGLRMLVYQLTEGNDEIKNGFPDINQEEKDWKKYYNNKITLAEYKVLDDKIMRLMSLHNKKFKDGNWSE